MTNAGEKLQKGDRVKLIGSHRFAGYTAEYQGERNFPFAGTRPWVKIERTGEYCYVAEPETQMRKI